MHLIIILTIIKKVIFSNIKRLLGFCSPSIENSPQAAQFKGTVVVMTTCFCSIQGKIENVQKMGFIKGPMFKGVASSRFLPKGTKTKVNLEEQGRQKVSFSFSLTKKTLQNRFLTALGNDKQNDTPNSPAIPLQADFVPKIKMDPGDTSAITEESSPPKPKVELGKIHFKKHLLHVTSKPLVTAVTSVATSPPLSIIPSPVVTESVVAESPPQSPPPPPLALQVRTPSPPAPISVTTALPQIPTSVPVGTSLQSPPIDVAIRASKESLNIESLELDTKQDTCSSELIDIVSQNVSEKVDISPLKEDSHIGKEEETPDSSKSSLCSKKTSTKKKFSQSEGMFLGSESDEDSVQTSSSQRSHDLKNSASVEKERDSKKNLVTLKGEDLGKSSRSKTERDDKHFSYSKLDRDSRYLSSRSRSERERRRSRSRSRSDRGSRTSSYSRSERSHYYESERRYHRSSPYRERPRYSRSYADNRMRESSDSEEEYKKIYSRSSDSRRTSSHSSFYRDSRTSTYSKSDRDNKIESFHMDAEKRGKYSSKPERESKRTSENELMKRCCSPPNEVGCRRGASYSKHDSNASRNKSVPWKNPQKPDKIKSSFCCIESTEEIKHQSHSLNLQTTCSKSNELRMVVKIPERDKTISPSSAHQLNDSPTFKKLGESSIFKPELLENDSHDSIKEVDTLSKGKLDHLRTYCPTELDINGSPGEISDLATFCVSKTEDIFTSSDDSINRSEVSPLIKTNKSCVLPSNGFQSINRSKEKDLDDSSIQHSELNSSLKEMDPSPSQDKLGSFPTITLDYSKTVKESVDLKVSYCKTKDLDSCNTLDDSSPHLYQLETENIEPPIMKVIPNSFMIQDSELQSVISDNKSCKNLHSLQPTAEEPEQNRVKSTKPCDSNSPVGSSTGGSVCSLTLGIKVNNPPINENTEGRLPLGLDTVLQNQSTEFIKKTGIEIIELDEQQTNPEKGKRIVSWKSRHNSGLPMECSETEEEVQEQANVTLTSGRERVAVFTEESFNKQEGSRNIFISESLLSSCDRSGTVEGGDSIAHTPKCDSSGNASEFVSPIHGDYSDSSHSTSDESDSEDTDSDDSSIPRNRLQSVVVVPKNSTLPTEEISPCSSQSSQVNRHYSDHWEDDRPESGKSYEERFEGMMSKNCSQTEKFSLPKGADKSPEIPFMEPSRKQMENLDLQAVQPQSDGVDSTSQAEVVSDTISLKSIEERTASKESLIITKPILRQQEELPVYSSDGFEGVLMKSRQQNNFPNRPDSRLGKADSDNFSSSGDFSRVDGFHSAEDLGNLGWDFSQPEKPSTTYQQPDSSYGVYAVYNYQQNAEQYRGSTHNYWQGNGYWDPRLASRPSGITYDRVQGHIPDSLTNDHEEDEENWDDPRRPHFSNQSGKFLVHLHKEKGSVQAHEISSNSIKDLSIINEKKVPPKNLEKGDMKDRGPPKKRRQELESDSESDSDMQERKKVRVEVEQLEMFPSGSGLVGPLCVMDDFRDPQRWKECARQGKMPCYFDLIEENVYLTERKKNKSHRDIKRMQCECTPVSKDDRAQGEIACGEDCLNRLLMIECSSRCPNGDYCSNRRFQRKQHADVEVILTEKKGWGLRAAKDLPSNTFVLEYCGEVLDHKEFKARVKEYARNKNIHYYFMALKNDEIIDATQKGNCSRFMNHSCEPNCETQKWTVNGQLRVGFFTTKLVPSGSELTFDYQFQRYGKEAQKCFCGSANCRGYLGGENRVSIRAAGGKMKKERSRKKDSVDGELEALLENGEGLSDKNQVLSLSRLMVRIETLEQKLTCLKLIQNTQSQSCLKSFLECHGLSLLWIWMAELGDGRGNNQKLQEEIIKTLEHLPIPTKNMLEESKVLPIIQRWSQTKTAVPHFSEGDGYSSENTSRAHTPLNTPDPSTKLNTEADTDTPKKLVFRRLKIISENSMDSAISDATSELEGKDGKEDLDQLENAPVEEDEESQPQQLQPQQLTPQHLPPTKGDIETPVDCSKQPASEPEAEHEAEAKESNGPKLEEPIAMETPSQDEEEGVSDVESERSQEQPDKTVDISDLATKLLDSWKDLKLLRAARSLLTSPADHVSPFLNSIFNSVLKKRENLACIL
ncbi:histone-lysine N-methyltransferase SETD2 isoform X2 [Macrotis lagotis]|uniref:histone-lysine N-methyltransferase SETD2 isoform X2 n=1 Tax=Macrotis lagotis TaxID=92651 RepID=UPI003D687452